MKATMSNFVLFSFDLLLAVVGYVSFALKRKILCNYYFLLKRKKLSRQPNTFIARCSATMNFSKLLL